ncbi:MAG: agmatinase [Desulfamplus sp.]|nr:agmatinase [Desulfamplus sp.]
MGEKKSSSIFLASEIIENREEFSLFHVIPAPMESSVSYGNGTAAGPQAILNASDQLEGEVWDYLLPLEQTDDKGSTKLTGSAPLELGIHTTAPVNCHGCPEMILDRIESAVTRALSFNAIPVLLGGEHTVTLGALRALKKALVKQTGIMHKPFGIIQIDAHADLRNSYEGTQLSHACVMRRAVDELGIALFQLGVRAICKEEALFRREENIPFIDARELYLKGVPDTLLPEGFPEKIYITIDVDGLDPSVIRATGTPVPGGIGWHDTLTLLGKSITGREVIGFDVVELAPVDKDYASDFAAAQLTYSVMGMIQRLSRKPGSN